MTGTATARVRDSITYLPIDGLIAHLEDALAEIVEIEWRYGPHSQQFSAPRNMIDQRQLLRLTRGSIAEALERTREYAKGPAA